jgi:two-component system CheB/CheR fusion protein
MTDSQEASSRAAPTVATTASGTASPTHLVGIGASAGGLEALEAFFNALPADTGMAFVVVPHLSPDFRSYLPELLGRCTSMKVVALQERTGIEANHVYVLGPGKELTVEGEELVAHERPANGKLHLPINRFFRSLACWGERAVAIVLSGTGSDGSLGLEDVHTGGGTVLAQTSESSRFDGMPRSAAQTGLIDAALEPAEMGKALVAISAGKAASLRELAPDHVDERDPEYGDILRLLRETYDIDFNYYKPGTVIRRIERRLSLNRPEESLADYARRLSDDRGELDQLFRDLLIGVTRFFRDPEAFEAVRGAALGAIVDALPPDEDLRVWVCGCSTGEEAYSIAMLAHQVFESRRREPRVRVFATDLHAVSLQTAAAGLYPAESLEQVPPPLREKNFVEQEGGHFKVTADLRKAVIFSRHNVIRDPAFTRMDLVTCRNLLIYLRPEAQAQALAAFHFALKPDGFLFLGESETPGELDPAFDIIDRRQKLYRKDRSYRPAFPLLRDRLQRGDFSIGAVSPTRASEDGLALGRVYDALLDRHMPAGLLLNEQHDVIHVFGDAVRYLKPRVGRFRANALSMLDAELRVALAGAVREAAHEAREVSYGGVRVHLPDGQISLRLTVEPVLDKVVDRAYFLVTLRPEGEAVALAEEPSRTFSVGHSAAVQIGALESELHHARERLQSTVEQLETTNEELQSSNEELIASNEELQSTNEELHAVNEELHTVNGEHQQKIVELNAASSDLHNLIRSSGIATLFVDGERHIRLYTPAATRLFHLLPHDVGRDLFDFMPLVPDPWLHEDLATSAAGDEVPERRLDGADRVTLARRITPYRDGNNKVSGHVLTYLDISTHARFEAELTHHRDHLEELVAERTQALRVERDGAEASRAQFENLISLAPEALLVSDPAGGLLRWNAVAAELFGYAPEAMAGLRIEDLVPPAHREAHVAARAGFMSSGRANFMDRARTFAAQRADGSTFDAEVSLSAIVVDGQRCAIAVVRDQTELVRAKERSDAANRAKSTFLANMSHEIRTPMNAIMGQAQLLMIDQASPEHRDRLETIMGASRHLLAIIDDILDLSKIEAGKLALELADFRVADVFDQAATMLAEPLRARGLTLIQELDPRVPARLHGDARRLEQILINYGSNAVKFTAEGHVVLRALLLEDGDADALVRFEVEDTGIGVPPDQQSRLFQPFEQVDGSTTRKHGGTGLGLSICRHLARLMRGDVGLRSEPGTGSTFWFTARLGRVAGADARPEHARSATLAELRQLATGARVLLVDDDEIGRALSSDMIQWLTGVDADLAGSGVEAVARARARGYDLILMDMQMPEMDGLTASRLIRDLPGHRATPIVGLTANAYDEDRQRCLDAGMNEHLPKPVSMTELGSALVRWLGASER